MTPPTDPSPGRWLNLAALGAGLAVMILHAGRGLVGADRAGGLALVRRRLVLAQTLYAVAALTVLTSPQVSIVTFGVVQTFFVVSPRLPVRV